jgi:AcrR family transcriptional regulator
MSDPAEVGARLHRAAVVVLTESGLAGLKPDRVDRRAGLPAGTCRSHYHSDTELIAAVLESAAARYHGQIAAVMQSHPDDPVTAIAVWMSNLIANDRANVQMLCSLLFDPPTRRRITTYADALLFGWERMAATRLHLSREQVDNVFLLIEGWILAIILHGRPAPAPDVIATTLRTILAAQPSARG